MIIFPEPRYVRRYIVAPGEPEVMLEVMMSWGYVQDHLATAEMDRESERRPWFCDDTRGAVARYEPITNLKCRDCQSRLRESAATLILGNEPLTEESALVSYDCWSERCEHRARILQYRIHFVGDPKTVYALARD